jgi:hypothetical protein
LFFFSLFLCINPFIFEILCRGFILCVIIWFLQHNLCAYT